MSKATDRFTTPYARPTGEKSVFRIPVSNALGIDAREQRAKLKNFALTKPADYTKFREDTFIKIVKNFTEFSHDAIWNLLSDGMTPDGVQLTYDGKDFTPKLPEDEIGKAANGFAESIMDAFETILDKIMPDEYAKLADDKMLHIAKIQGVARGLGV